MTEALRPAEPDPPADRKVRLEREGGICVSPIEPQPEPANLHP